MTFTVTDSSNKSSSASVVVNVNSPGGIAAAITSPTTNVTITAGQSVNFQGSATGGTAPYTYQWNFGGGATNSSVQNPGNVTFSSAGSYTVTFTVTDANGGTSSASVTITVQTQQGSLIFSDNFDSYALGTFPSSGGWQIIYNGAGTSYQYIDNTHSVSGSQSLHLEGSSCWGAQIFNTINIPASVIFEYNIFIDSIVSGGCTPDFAIPALFNPSIGSWGTGFGGVSFNNDGNIYAVQSYSDVSKNILLMPYSAQTWYLVKTVVDLTARTFTVYINGVLRGSSNQIMDSGMPTGISINAGHGNNPTVWYDNVTLYSN